MQNTSRMIQFMVTLILVALLTTCSSEDTPLTPDGNIDTTGGGPGPGPAGKDSASAAELAKVATDLYSFDNAVDIEQALRDFFDAYGLRVVDGGVAANTSGFAVQEADSVFILGAQIQRMARAFNDGVMIDLDSFLGQLRGKGVRGQEPPYGSVTRAYIEGKLQEHGILDKIDNGGTFKTEDDLIPALIVMLGRERAKDTWIDHLDPMDQTDVDAWADPIWGDNLLDPLQFMLFSYAALLSSVGDPPPSSGTPATATQEDRYGKITIGFITGKIGEWLGVPLTKKQAMQAAVCSSVILYGYKFQVSATETNISRPFWDPTVDPIAITREGPDESVITATLSYTPIPASELHDYACEQPSETDVANKNLTWKIYGDIRFNGNLSQKDDATNDQGIGTATFTANGQMVPPYLRTTKSIVPGWVWVSATGLDATWPGLEMGVDFLRNPTGTPVEIWVARYARALGVRLDGGQTFLGEQIEGTPLANSLLVCGDNQLGGEPVDGSRQFSQDENNYSKTFNIDVTSDKVTFVMSADNENQFAWNGISMSDLLVIDVVNPRPSMKPRWKVTWSENPLADDTPSYIYVGCTSRPARLIMDSEAGEWISGSHTSTYGLTELWIRKGGVGPGFGWFGELTIELTDEQN